MVQRIVHPLSIFAVDNPNMFAKNTLSASTLPTTFAYFIRRLVACPLLWKQHVLVEPGAVHLRSRMLTKTTVLRRLAYSAHPLMASETVGTVKEALALTIEPNRTMLTRFG